MWATGADLPGWHQPPRLEGEVHADLCVIGLGGSGLAAVAEALDAGQTVVGIDAGPIAGRAAGRNGGFLLAGTALFHHDAVRRYGRERALAWYRGTVEEIERMAAADPEVRQVGSVRLAIDDQEAADVERQLAVMRDDGLAVEAFDPTAPDAGVGAAVAEDAVGLLVPDDAMANPLARCRRLAARCVDAGAQLFTDSPATTVSGNRVTTPDGVVHCDAVVVAVDGVLGAILPELAPRVRPVRLQMLGTEPTDEVTVPRPVYARWGLDYWSQAPDGRIALGGGRDQGGDEEEAARPEPSEPVQDHLETLLRERIGVTAPISHRWAATVGFTPSGLPLCEQVRPGVWAIGGYSGTGNVIGAMLGRIAVELAVTGSSDRADLLFDT
ncbi:FAD-binding oxidoreductase [Nitriliruptoria bacterium AS10]|nr:FAD-binding oxidoreductase [Salsipaludibacter albus]